MQNARAICDRSGFEGKLSEMVKTWDGFLVLPAWWEPRNPQDFVTGVREHTLPYSRPEPPDVFISTPVTATDL